ncbi:MAG TPA: SH3 domain-containing protein [Allosphingosinicella sp.]|jgi:hypothetical protein
MTRGLITYQENGFPVELVTDRDIRRGIEQGKLRPDTVVTHHASDGSISTRRASELPDLRPFFALPAEDAVAEVPAPEPRKERPKEPQPVVESIPEVERPSPSAGLPGEPSSEDEDVQDTFGYRREPESESNDHARVVLWALVVTAILALAFCSISKGGSPTAPEANLSEGVPAGSPTDVIGQEASYWANREVRARQLPSTSSKALGSLKRGDLIRAVQVRGPTGAGDWVRIEGGEFAGGYVWAANLSQTARPELASEDAETKTIASGKALYAEPDLAAPQLQSLAPGAQVKVVGKTQNGWWEIALAGGGVGYLEPVAIVAGCLGVSCRILTPDGWGGIRAGMTIEAAEAASGMGLVRPGHYDEAFADEPGRAQSCNIHGLVGAPANISVFVQDGIITSIGADLSEEGGAGSRLETDRGVGLGDSEDDVRRAYSKLEEKPDIYSEPPDKKLFFRGAGGNGIKFSIVNGRVTEIVVGGDSIEYVEGCL